jgi:hypothetical protein
MPFAVVLSRRLATHLLALGVLAATVLGAQNALGAAEHSYQLRYRADLSQSPRYALVRIELSDNSGVSAIDFNLDEAFHSELKASGELTLKNGRALWHPPSNNAWLSLNVQLPHKRDSGGFDALREDDFTIFRGDDLIPAAVVRGRKGISSQATLQFTLPQHWTSVNSGWPKQDDERTFTIDNPERRFDRPTGWFIAGKLGTRREYLAGTHVVVSGPTGQGLRRLDVLSFVLFNWPTLQQIVGDMPPKVLLVMAGDPMWRGGLSGPNSLFVHADRPMVSENGTSTLLHELVHTLTRISGAQDDDWIAEGLAEYYSYTILHRAGGLSDARLARVKRWLADWSREVKTLRGGPSSGRRTARAALLLGELDTEIRQRTQGDKSLDDATRAMMQQGKVSLTQLRDIVAQLTGEPSKVLQSALLEG